MDYARVVRIFAPPRDGTPLEQRIADGERSWFFAHHAAYAAATIDDDIAASDPAFKLAPHYLMDTRLMIAWSRALARAGELDKARHLAQRLREFRNPQAEEFFDACDAPRGRDGTALPVPAPAGNRQAGATTCAEPARLRLQSSATQSPDLPPLFFSSRMSPMTMPRSTALHMS